MAEVQIRLVGKTPQEVEAALMLLQAAAGLQVRRWPRRGRKDEWLAYGIVSISLEGQALKAEWTQQEIWPAGGYPYGHATEVVS